MKFLLRGSFVLRRMTVYIVALIVAWSLILTAIFLWNIHRDWQQTLRTARMEAKSFLQKDILYRDWNARNGGVFVLELDTLALPPFFSVPELTLQSVTGEKLTKINPDRMVWDAYRLQNKNINIRKYSGASEIKESRYLPDMWEKKALTLFARQKEDEYSEIFETDGVFTLRLMVPLIVNHNSIRYYGSTGFKLGDLWGGMSVTLPLKSYLSAYASYRQLYGLSHLLLWLLGIAGIFLGYLQVAKKVKDRDQAFRRLGESEGKFRELAEQSPNMIFINKDGKVVYANKRCQEIMGYSLREIYEPNFDFTQLVAPESRELVLQNFKRHLKGEEISPYEYSLITKNGTKIVGIHNTKLIDYEGGKAILGIITDVTQRKLAEDALRESEEKYRNLIERSNDAIYLLFENKFEIINRRFTEIFGYTLEDLSSANFNFLDLVAPASRPLILERMQRLEKDQPVTPIYEFFAITRDGREIECEVSVSYVAYKGGQATQGIIRDITARKAAETQLIRLASVIQQTSDSVMITDVSGEIEYVNAAFEKITGYSMHEVKGKNPRLLKSGTHDNAFYENLWQTITSGNVWEGTFINRKKDGTIYYEKATIFPIKNAEGKTINYAAVKQDITEMRLLEEQFLQAQKMESIGRLAGGVAHDFNNLLTVIKGYCDLILEKSHEDYPYYREVELIKKAGEKASNLTSQLLAFSRKQVIQPRVVNLNQIVADLNKMLQRLIGEDIELEMFLSPELGNVHIDPGQFEQVFLNLAINARDAMPLGGKLTIETANVEIDEEYTKTHLAIKPGSFIMLAISDTGVGMSKETQEKIFEPFFTTKEQGKGTGLGLSTVYGIVKQNDGFIWVYSEPGQGTTFKIYLPRVSESAKKVSSAGKKQTSLKGTETVLVVEDDASVREFVREVCTGNGYTVLAAETAQEAIRLCQEFQKPVHLLLSDVVMAHMSGRDLAEKIVAYHPEIKILFMSGYTDNAIVHHGVLKEGIEFIQKPFTPTALLEKIRSVLEK